MFTLRRKQDGFTIVELLIVIIVIGILATLVLVTFTGVQQKARNTQRETDVKAVASHLETYNAENGKYPTADDLNNVSSATWVKDNLKGLDPAATCDPKSPSVASPPCTFATSSTSQQYGYAPTKDDGSACDNSAGNECSKFALTYTDEGGSQQTVNSLN